MLLSATVTVSNPRDSPAFTPGPPRIPATGAWLTLDSPAALLQQAGGAEAVANNPLMSDFLVREPTVYTVEAPLPAPPPDLPDPRPPPENLEMPSVDRLSPTTILWRRCAYETVYQSEALEGRAPY